MIKILSLLMFAAVVAATTAILLASGNAVLAFNELATRQNTFYFEQHGRDDAREWQAMFKKGVRLVKSDWNWIEAAQCKTQQRVRQNESTQFPNGCFVITHYYDNQVVNYFTPDDYVDFFEANAGADWLSPVRVARSGPITVQMCLKNRPSGCCPQTPGTPCFRYALLFDRFFAAVNSRLPDLIVFNRLRFVFDSIGAGNGTQDSDCSCFFYPTPRWRGPDGRSQVISTWVGNGDSAHNNSGSFAMEMMPNMCWSSHSAWAQIGGPAAAGGMSWGKWRGPQAPNYVICAWEPAAELETTLWFDWFISTQLYHPPGAVVAFNADPSMFHTYNAANTRRFAHTLSGRSEMEGAVAAMFSTRADINHSSQFENMLRCASSSSPLSSAVECIIHVRANHSQFIPVASTLSVIPAALTKRFTLPLLHIAVENVVNKSDASCSAVRSVFWRVTFADSAGVLHFLAMSLDAASAEPKWNGLCVPVSPFGASSTTNKVFSVNSFWDSESVPQNNSGNSNNKPLTFVAALLNADLSMSVVAISFLSAPTDGMPCSRWQVVLAPTVLVANVCNNNTKDCGSFEQLRGANPRLDRAGEIVQMDTRWRTITTSSSSSSSSKKKRKDNQKQSESAKTVKNQKSITNWFSAGVAGGVDATTTTTVTMKILLCWNVKMAVYCSSSRFAAAPPLFGMITIATRNYSLASVIPNVSAVPVKVGVGMHPTISFAQTTPAQAAAHKNANRSDGAFVITWGKSFCQNDLLIDDNTGNFFPWHICDLRDAPQFLALPWLEAFSVIQVYLYSRGGVAALEEELGRGNLHINGFASVCDAHLMHGAFDTSRDAGVPLLLEADPARYDQDLLPGGTNNEDGSHVAVVVSTSLFIGSPTTCGSSLPGFGAIRTDAFPLPGMIFSIVNSSGARPLW